MTWNDLFIDIVAMIEPEVEKKATDNLLSLVQLLSDLLAVLSRRPRPAQRIFRAAPALIELVKKTLKNHADDERRLYASHKLLAALAELGDESLRALFTPALVQSSLCSLPLLTPSPLLILSVAWVAYAPALGSDSQALSGLAGEVRHHFLPSFFNLLIVPACRCS